VEHNIRRRNLLLVPEVHPVAVKHLPRISADDLKEKKLFDGFHTNNKKIPLAQKYLSSFKGERKQNIVRLTSVFTSCQRRSLILLPER
jgi:hypothetical protein